MGKRLHVAMTYVVEWGDTEAFNWKYDTFRELLDELGADTNITCEEEASYDFEVSKENYETAMANMEQYIKDPEGLSDEVYADDIRRSIEKLEMEPEKILELMHDYYNEAHKADGYLHFAAW